MNQIKDNWSVYKAVSGSVYWSVNLTLNFATNLHSHVYVPLVWTVDTDVGGAVGNAVRGLR